MVRLTVPLLWGAFGASRFGEVLAIGLLLGAATTGTFAAAFAVFANVGGRDRAWTRRSHTSVLSKAVA